MYHKLFTLFYCADTSVIYCIISDKCGKMYIGLTSNNLRTRFRAHRHFSVTKKHSRPLYRQFAYASHDFNRDYRIVPLEHCEPDALPEREAFWIRTLHTLLPNGLNAAYGKPYYPYDKSLLCRYTTPHHAISPQHHFNHTHPSSTRARNASLTTLPLSSHRLIPVAPAHAMPT